MTSNQLSRDLCHQLGLKNEQSVAITEEFLIDIQRADKQISENGPHIAITIGRAGYVYSLFTIASQLINGLKKRIATKAFNSGCSDCAINAAIARCIYRGSWVVERTALLPRSEVVGKSAQEGGVFGTVIDGSKIACSSTVNQRLSDVPTEGTVIANVNPSSVQSRRSPVEKY